MAFDERCNQFVTQSQVDRQTGRDFPIVLKEEALFPVRNVHGRSGKIYKRDRCSRLSQKEYCERIDAALASIADQTPDISAIHGEPIKRLVANEIGAHFKSVFADNPGQSVAEGCQVLIHRAVCVSSAILKYCKVPAELHSGMTMCRQLRRANHRTISVDVRLIESNTRKEAFERGIAVAAQSLLIEAAARLIDHIGAEYMRVGKGERVVSAFILLQTQSGIRILHQVAGSGGTRRIVDTVDMVAFGEVMVNTKRAYVTNRASRQQGLVSAEIVGAVNRARHRIDRRGEADLRKVSAN